MKNVQEEQILTIFKKAGIIVELGATFSIRGQIAQLLNGCEELMDHCAIVAGKKAETQTIPDGQAIADVVREYSRHNIEAALKNVVDFAQSELNRLRSLPIKSDDPRYIGHLVGIATFDRIVNVSKRVPNGDYAPIVSSEPKLLDTVESLKQPNAYMHDFLDVANWGKDK